MAALGGKHDGTLAPSPNPPSNNHRRPSLGREDSAFGTSSAIPAARSFPHRRTVGAAITFRLLHAFHVFFIIVATMFPSRRLVPVVAVDHRRTF